MATVARVPRDMARRVPAPAAARGPLAVGALVAPATEAAARALRGMARVRQATALEVLETGVAGQALPGTVRVRATVRIPATPRRTTAAPTTRPAALEPAGRAAAAQALAALARLARLVRVVRAEPAPATATTVTATTPTASTPAIRARAAEAPTARPIRRARLGAPASTTRPRAGRRSERRAPLQLTEWLSQLGEWHLSPTPVDRALHRVGDLRCLHHPDAGDAQARRAV